MSTNDNNDITNTDKAYNSSSNFSSNSCFNSSSNSCFNFLKKLIPTSNCCDNQEQSNTEALEVGTMERRWRHGRRRRRRRRNSKKNKKPKPEKTIKLALLIGILYTGTSAELGGCVNDIINMKKLLIEKMGYQDKHIVMLHDEQENKSLQPTGENIIEQLNQLLNRTLKKPSKSNPKVAEVFIHFSGHGAYFKDDGNDESDGKDELIVPLDYETGGVITDDYLTYYMQSLPKHVKCTAVFDCCHSGTILDLKYLYKVNRNIIENKNFRGKAKIVMISGCKDSQTSADVYSPKKEQWNGALTTNLLNLLSKNKYNVTNFNLIKQLHIELRNQGHTQRPQICCSYKLNKKSKFIHKLGKNSYTFQ